MNTPSERSDEFRQRVSLAAVQVAGLSPEELAMALAYEVEPFSGVPATDAEIRYEAVAGEDPDVRVYDVSVCRRRGRAAAGARFVRVLSFAAAVAAVAVAADFAVMEWRMSSLGKAVAAQAPLDARLRQVQAEAGANRAEAARIRDARTARAGAHDRVERLRAAYPSLMGAVASACGGRMVVREFSSDGPFAVEMKAVAMSAGRSGEALAGLANAAGEVGWLVSPGGMQASEGGGTAVLDCRLTLSAGGGKGER